MKVLYIIILILSYLKVASQSYLLVCNNCINDTLSLSVDSIYNSEKSLKEVPVKLHDQLNRLGYFEHEIKLQTEDSIRFQLHVKLGSPSEWVDFKLSEEIEKLVPIFFKGFKGENIQVSKYYEKVDQVISFYENNGYPFVEVFLDDLEIDKKGVSGVLSVNKGQKYLWDTLYVEGDYKLKKSYLEAYLGIKEGELFSEKLFVQIQRKIKELPFAILQSPPKVEFSEGKAKLMLKLQHKSANMINGVLGVLPNSTSVLTNQKSQLVITGDLQLNLGNVFKYGEKIKFNWKRIQTQTQQLKTSEEIPYLFKTPFGITHELDLLKQDTSYVNYSNKIGLQYAFGPKKNMNAFWISRGTNQLSNYNISNQQLSSSTGNSNAYGLELNWDVLDYSFNPRRGWSTKIKASAGIKRFSGKLINNKVQLQFYNDQNIAVNIDVPKSSMLYQIEWNIEKYFPLFKITTIRIAANTGWLMNDFLLDNDLERLGGFKLLRGFDEQSILTTRHGVATLEYRFLFEENSNLGVFIDQALVEKSTLTDQSLDFPLGVGATLNFQTKPGIFSISYALGKYPGTSFDFSAAKIHFGFVNLF